MFWTQHAAEFLRSNPESLEIDHELVISLAQEYLTMVDPGHEGLRYVTDKNPTNVHLAGLLHGVFPNAKMIHLKRHPVDNLLSMWMTPFDESVRCASNRENLVAFYRDYLRLFKHLGEVLPEDRFTTVRYEDLTSNPETTIAGMLQYLGLESERACYEPEKKHARCAYAKCLPSEATDQSQLTITLEELPSVARFNIRLA